MVSQRSAELSALDLVDVRLILKKILILGAIGVLLGGIVGSRIKKKIDLNKLSIDQLHCF